MLPLINKEITLRLKNKLKNLKESKNMCKVNQAKMR